MSVLTLQKTQNRNQPLAKRACPTHVKNLHLLSLQTPCSQDLAPPVLSAAVPYGDMISPSPLSTNDCDRRLRRHSDGGVALTRTREGLQSETAPISSLISSGRVVAVEWRHGCTKYAVNWRTDLKQISSSFGSLHSVGVHNLLIQDT